MPLTVDKSRERGAVVRYEGNDLAVDLDRGQGALEVRGRGGEEIGALVGGDEVCKVDDQGRGGEEVGSVETRRAGKAVSGAQSFVRCWVRIMFCSSQSR